MNLVVVDPYDSNIVERIVSFYEKKSKQSEKIHSFLNISKTKTKEQYEVEKKMQVEIAEMIINIKDNEIINTCYYKGAKDNRLIELEIENSNDKNKKTNKGFLDSATNYAFFSLDAETVIIFSNEIEKDLLINNGYESLGSCNGINTYVKDRQKIEELGSPRK